MRAMDGERFPPVHRTHGVGHRNEPLQLTESFPEPPERRFQRFELPGSLSGPLRGPTISDHLRVIKSPKPKLKRWDPPAGPTEGARSIGARGVSVKASVKTNSTHGVSPCGGYPRNTLVKGVRGTLHRTST